MARATERPDLLVLVRHAESARNKAKGRSIYFVDDEARRTVKGVPDHKIPITVKGIDQAQKTGVYLYDNFGVPDYVYHSGYDRAIQTAQNILHAFPDHVFQKIQVRANLFLRERDPGYAYDMTEQEAQTAFPWLKEYWKTFGGFFARPPGGESVSDVVDRVHTFLDTLFRDRAGMRVWAVIHGGTMKAFRYLLERWTYEQAMNWNGEGVSENCGITVYQFDRSQKRLVLKEYNTVCW